MGKESKYFGLPELTPRERRIFKLLYWEQAMGNRWLRWRYRDRIHFGPGCRVDWRTLLLSGAGAVEFEQDVIIERGIHKVAFHLEPGSRVTIGRGVWIQTFDDDMVFSAKAGAEIRIGARSWFSGGIFGASKSIVIGEHTLIGWGCMVLDSDMHRLDNDAPAPEAEPVIIGSHVWMPSNITVLKGVTIGDHCVIGTGSLVASDVPAHSLAAGRPARVIRTLGDRDKVE